MSANISSNNLKVFNANDPCSLCLDNFNPGDKIARLGCGHIFHSECIQPWTQRKNNCPLDRRHITQIKDEVYPAPEVKTPQIPVHENARQVQAAAAPVVQSPNTAPRPKLAGSALAWMIKMGIKI